MPMGSTCAPLSHERTPELAVLLASADRVPPGLARVQASGARGFVIKSHLAATDLTQFWPS